MPWVLDPRSSKKCSFISVLSFTLQIPLKVPITFLHLQCFATELTYLNQLYRWKKQSTKNPQCLRVRKLVLLCFLYIQWPEQETPADSNSEQELNCSGRAFHSLNWLPGQTGETSLVSYQLNITSKLFHAQSEIPFLFITLTPQDPTHSASELLTIRQVSLSMGQYHCNAHQNLLLIQEMEQISPNEISDRGSTATIVCIPRNINGEGGREHHNSFKAWVIWWSINITLQHTKHMGGGNKSQLLKGKTFVIRS